MIVMGSGGPIQVYSSIYLSKDLLAGPGVPTHYRNRLQFFFLCFNKSGDQTFNFTYVKRDLYYINLSLKREKEAYNLFVIYLI
jgi:hypothetical protein